MFNRGSYNRARFNLPQRPAETEIAGKMLANVYSSADLSSDFYVKEAAAEDLGAKAAVGGRVYETFPAVERIAGTTVLSADYIVQRTRTLAEFNKHRFNIPKRATGISASGSFAALVSVGKDLHIDDAITGKIAAALALGGDLHPIVAATDSFEVAIIAAAEYTAPYVSGFEIVNCLVSTAIFDTLIVSIDVSIPPNGRLVIDSENFTALLNNENVLDKHDGAWLHMSRDIDEIKIDGGGTQSLKASVLYTERFL